MTPETDQATNQNAKPGRELVLRKERIRNLRPNALREKMLAYPDCSETDLSEECPESYDCDPTGEF